MMIDLREIDRQIKAEKRDEEVFVPFRNEEMDRQMKTVRKREKTMMHKVFPKALKSMERNTKELHYGCVA